MAGNSPHVANALQPGAALLWYTVRGVIGQGAFGITYLADDTNLERQVAIKEFLPTQLATRDASQSVEPLSSDLSGNFDDGLRRFVDEARTLAQFEHPNIVRVHNVFEANNTAYMVMRFEDGESLNSILKARVTLPEDELPGLIFPLLSGLEAVHAQGFIHRDIKPANIFIRRDGSPVLLDFGSARESLEDQTRTLTNFVSQGYAPSEQYTGKSNSQGPWTDIYGLSATLYRAVTGKSPVDAVERGQEIAHEGADPYTPAAEISNGEYSPGVLSAIDHGLAFRASDRPATIGEWRQSFEDVFGPATTPMTVPLTAPSETQARIRSKPGPIDPAAAARQRNMLLGASGAVLILLVLVAMKLTRTEAPPADETRPPIVENESAPAEIADKAAEPAPPATVETATDENESPTRTPSPVADLIAGAAADLAALRLTTPTDNNAYGKYQAVLALDPGNEMARRGIAAIASRYVELTYRSIGQARFEQAGEYLAKAESLSAGLPAIAEARVALDTARSAADGGEADAGNAAYEAQAEVMGKAFGAFVEEQQPADAAAPEKRSRGDTFLKRFGN